jgi:hypothetical protein
MAIQKGRNWSSGDIVTAANLSSIERGVSAVAEEYTPTTWANGDTVTAAALNNIEQGIVNAGGGSSDFSTATCTLVGEAVVNGSFYGYVGQDEYAVVYNTRMVGPYVEDNKFPIVLYKGKALIQVLDETVAFYSGDITELGNNYFFITGDCTITISSGGSSPK